MTDVLISIGDTVRDGLVLAIVLPLIVAGCCALVSLIKEMKENPND